MLMPEGNKIFCLPPFCAETDAMTAKVRKMVAVICFIFATFTVRGTCPISRFFYFTHSHDVAKSGEHTFLHTALHTTAANSKLKN